MPLPDLPRYDAPLTEVFRVWRAAQGDSPHAPDPAGSVTVDIPAGPHGLQVDSATIPLDKGAASVLTRLLIGDIHLQHVLAARRERDAEIVDGIVAAVRAGDDGGDVIASAVATAARNLPRPTDLIAGRPGSWEAAIVERMTVSGGAVPHDSADPGQQRILALAELITGIGQGRNQGHPEDGGDTLSQICGAAAERLGSIGALIGEGHFAEDVDNLSCSYVTEQVRGTSIYH